MTSFLSMHREKVCSLYCVEYNSCLYYSYSDVDELCFLCIYNDDDVFQNSLRLDAVDENRENDVIQLRSDVSSIMTQTPCHHDAYGRPGAVRFNYTQPRVTRIDLCTSSFYTDSVCGAQVVSGFRLYVNGVGQERWGSCENYYQNDVGFDLFDGEVLLHVKLHFPSLCFGFRFYTNWRSFGSFNPSCSSVEVEFSGYNFLGFHGWAVVGLDQLGANFER